MKSKIKLLSLPILFLLSFVLTTVKAEAAEKTLTSSSDLRSVVETAGSGDTINLNGNTFTINDTSQAGKGLDPWLIDKNLTFKNGTIDLRPGGIILGGNVTFENVQLSFPNTARNVIAANGYTLTLTNTTRAKNLNGSNSAQQVHLFCGSMFSQSGQVGTITIPPAGPMGRIIITGDNIDLGNIYAGHIYTDGSMNIASTIPAEITINVTNSNIGMTHTDTIQSNLFTVESGIYSSGALETPAPGLTLDSNYIQLPPMPASAFPVNAEVTININDGTIKKIDGNTYGTAANANIIYNGGSNLVNTITFINPGSLTVRAGKLAPSSSSDLTYSSVNVSGSGRLGFTNLGSVILDDFTGSGGTIVLNPNQTIIIDGNVSGQAKVSIGNGSYNGDESTSQPVIDHTYLSLTLGSSDDAFTLWPYAGNPNIALVNDGGNWKAKSTTVAPALTFTDDAAYNIPASTVGTAIQAIDVSPAVSGGTPPYTYTATGLPAGISIDRSTGLISGTPTTTQAAATATITVTDDAASAASANITIAVGQVSAAAVPPPTSTYSVAASVSPAAAGTISGTGSFKENDSVTLVAKASSGYTFKGWEASDVGINSSTNSTLTFTMPAKNVTVIARFEQTAAPANTYSVSASINPTAGGSVSGTGSFKENDSVTLVAKASSGYTFKGWEASDVGINSSTNSTLTFTMPAKNVTVTARFEQITTPTASYSIAASANPAEGGSVYGASGSFKEKATVTLVAKTNPGYAFKGWESSDITITGSVSPNLTFTMPAKNITVTAKYEKVTTSGSPSGSGNQNSSGSQSASGNQNTSGGQSGSGSQNTSGGSQTSSTTTTASGTQKIVFNGLTEIPAALRPTYPNVASLMEAMLTKATAVSGYSRGNTIFYDVKLQLSSDGGKTWRDATEADFSSQGIRVFFSYPQGTGKNTHDFLVTHMFTQTSSRLGTVAGNIEQPPVTKLDNGLEVTLKGLSPVSISWKTIGTTTVPKAPKTGEFTTHNVLSEILPWICIGMVSSIILVGTGLHFCKKKKH